MTTDPALPAEAAPPSPRPRPAPPVATRKPHELVAHGDRRVDDWYWLRDRDDPDVIAYLEAENAYADAVLAPLAPLTDRLFEEIKGRVIETDVSSPSRSGPWWYWNRTLEGAQYGIVCRRADPERRLGAPEVLADARAALAAVGAEAEEGKGSPGDGDVVLDENELAAEHDFFSLGVFDVNGDHRILAYAIDVDGSERYRLRFRDLERGEDLDDVVEGVTYGSAWGTDNRTLWYVRPDAAMRPYQVWRHTLGSPATADVLAFEETDERFFVSVDLTRSRRYVVVSVESKTTSSAWALDASTPDGEPVELLPRRAGVEYDVEHAVLPGLGDAWLVRTNAPEPGGRPNTDFALYALGGGAVRGAWEALVEVVPHRDQVKIEAVMAFAGHVVVTERRDGLEALRVLRLAGDGTPRSAGQDRRGQGPDSPAGGAPGSGSPGSGTTGPGAGSGSAVAAAFAGAVADEHVVAQPDPVYSLAEGANDEWDTHVLRFGYTSLVAPMSSIDYDLDTRARDVVRVKPVRDYRAGEYRTERIWATAADGTQIPISLVCRADAPRDGTAPCLLYGYGSYEITIDPTFSSARLTLIDRGFTFAIAHIRGGGELGRRWYDEGKLAAKPNTFSDFVACGEHLIAEGWTSADRLVARGGSAGGLLMGAVANLRPDLWRAVVAEVPFVDVVTTMSDPSLPLTVTEWEEWGNPLDDPDAYRVMRSYSPYDNLVAADYPAMYVTAGLNDPRVGFWEPAKWVAKQRLLRTDDRPLVLRTELGAGHQGPSGRYRAWRDEARVQAFVLSQVGIDH